jgi:hypothetical protein
MLKILPVIFVLSFLSVRLNGQLKMTSDYVSPIRTPLSFSGGFGELRRNHFHTGLDFRTSGQTGIPVYAAKEGSVARISVSASGYGNALYLVHPDGNTTVYGHLQRFHPKIEAYVRSQQYSLKQFAVNLTLPAGSIAFKKGDLVAWSGNSGSSGGPHLHFEVRNTISEKPQNPISYIPGILDKSSPRIFSLYLYPLSANSSVNKSRNKVRLETIPANHITRLKNQLPAEVYGDIGVGIQTDDDFNGAGFKCGIYSAELYLDQELVYTVRFDHLAFDQGRYVNSYADYEELAKSKRWIQRLFLQPGNKMEISKTNDTRGILKLSDGKTHQVKIIVSDAFNNATSLSFKLISNALKLPDREEEFTRKFYYDKQNKYETSDLKIVMQEGSLYEDLNFLYRNTVKNGQFVSQIHSIHNQYVPVHLPYSLSIKTLQVPLDLQSKILIVMVNNTGNLSPVGGDYSEGWITARPRAFGDFAVVTDTVPPVIRPVNIRNNNLVNKARIDFKITDNLSGIEIYEGEIDGDWVLFEYDAKTDMLSYTIDKSKLKPGRKHSLQLRVADQRKNVAVYKTVFYL